MAVAVGMYVSNGDQKNQTKPMQYIPIAAVPMTNTRGPQTTLLQRGREGEHQVEDHRNKCLHKTESEHSGRRGRRTDIRCHTQQEEGKEKETRSPESECRKGKR